MRPMSKNARSVRGDGRRKGRHIMGSILTDEQKQQFREQGYVVFPRFFSDEETQTLKDDIDALEEARGSGSRPGAYEFPELGRLLTHPKVMDMAEDVLGPGFAFHHLHAVRQGAGAPESRWHQDYEQIPHTNRSHDMVHVFYYLNGLNGQIGDLLFVPRTQKTVIDNNALSLLGTEDIPGTVVVNDLPPGSAVMVHSALWHARRAKPGGENAPRYFADASYCQAGIRWPGYPRYGDMLARITELGLDRDGRYAHLFDPGHFFDQQEARASLKGREGSLALALAAGEVARG